MVRSLELSQDLVEDLPVESGSVGDEPMKLDVRRALPYLETALAFHCESRFHSSKDELVMKCACFDVALLGHLWVLDGDSLVAVDCAESTLSLVSILARDS